MTDMDFIFISDDTGWPRTGVGPGCGTDGWHAGGNGNPDDDVVFATA